MVHREIPHTIIYTYYPLIYQKGGGDAGEQKDDKWQAHELTGEIKEKRRSYFPTPPIGQVVNTHEE